MNKQARISIITPSYNQSEFIERTILSVLSQKTELEIEYIIFDGASTDGTLDILNKYSAEIQWFSTPDRGQADAVNKGIAIASGEIIGWLNSDDLYTSGALQKVLHYFESNPECQWLYGQCNIIDDTETEIRRWMTKYKNFRARKFNDKSLLFENCICQPAVFFRKSIFDKVGLLSIDLPFAMDYDLWFRLAKHYKPGIINCVLASFRVHKDSKSTRNSRKQFLEQYLIHKRYDKRKRYLLQHRAYIYIAASIYRLMSKL
jgi:GT2 family glycosyltransferase